MNMTLHSHIESKYPTANSVVKYINTVLSLYLSFAETWILWATGWRGPVSTRIKMRIWRTFPFIDKNNNKKEKDTDPRGTHRPIGISSIWLGLKKKKTV